MFNSVISKLMVFTLAISLMISVAIVTTVIYEQHKSSRAELIGKAETLSNILTQVLINPIYDLKINQITEFLHIAKEDVDVVEAWVLDVDGLIISDGSEDNEMQDEEPKQLRSVIERVINTRAYEISQSDELYLMTSPVFSLNEEIIGFVHLKISSFRENQQLKDELIILLSLSLMLFVLGMLVAYYSARKLIAPVAAMRDATNLIATGDFSKPLPVNGKDELAQLSAAINWMSESLESTTVSKNYVQNIIDSMSDSLFVMDENGEIVTVNQPLLILLGFNESELIGHKASKLYGDSNDCDLNTITSKKHINFYTKKAEDIPIDLSLRPLLSSGVTEKWFVGVAQDVRDKIAAEKQLKQAVIAAEAATIAKSQFLATMSHEIRTPMNGVLGMAQLLEGTTLDNEQSKYVDTIISSGDGLLTIINDILDFSKLESDMTNLEQIPFSLERTCRESLELLSSKTIENNLELIFDYHPQCPANFIGDPSRLRQILLNILGNSVKFTSQGYIRLGVSYQDQGLDNKLRFEIEDTGIGIEKKSIEHLFDKFTQADQATTRKFGGTGLGLAITKKLVTLMDGEMGVESQPGVGTTFWFQVKLPVTDSPEHLSVDNLKGVRILYIDDSLNNGEIFSRLLNYMGAETVVLDDPVNTCDILERALSTGKSFDIAILNYNMKAKKGIELGREIRKQQAFDSLKLLMVTSSGLKGDARIIHQAGFNAYTSMLVSREILQSILLTMMKQPTNNQLITQHSIIDAKQIPRKKSSIYSAKVLVVEDVLINQVIAKKILEVMGVTVELANNGQQAVDAVRHTQFDLIFMDCQMPIMDGYQASHEIRLLEQNNAKYLPIIALTANASNDDREKCKQAGMDYVVTKPFKRDDLEMVLMKWLNPTVTE